MKMEERRQHDPASALGWMSASDIARMLTFDLEMHLRRKLNLALRSRSNRAVDSVVDYAKARRAWAPCGVGLVEVGMIEEIEELGAKLHFPMLRQLGLLDQRSIELG